MQVLAELSQQSRDADDVAACMLVSPKRARAVPTSSSSFSSSSFSPAAFATSFAAAAAAAAESESESATQLDDALYRVDDLGDDAPRAPVQVDEAVGDGIDDDSDACGDGDDDGDDALSEDFMGGAE
jgi:hypothetical protein